MTTSDIECYLSDRNISLDKNILLEIDRLLQSAKDNNDETEANYYWCLKQVFVVQNGFLSAFSCLKKQQYEEAWNILDDTDIALCFLGNNYKLKRNKNEYHLALIERMIKEYQKLFPYTHFISRESIIKSSRCSICGESVSLRHSCGHKVGKLYMGTLCIHEVTDMEFLGAAIVSDPFDKYAYLKFEDQEYDYSVLDSLMHEINDPYTEFSVEESTIQNPFFKGVKPNQQCPCGSGKKYKKCHFGTKDELQKHYKIVFS